MAYEQLANNAGTTLNGTINNSVTSLVVTSATAFPSAGNFRILIDSELMLVTAVSGSTFTVTRGIEGTTAASHTSGVNVDHVLTKTGLDQYLADRMLTDTTANLPSAGVAGRVFLPSDGSYLYRDTGAAWSAWGPLYPMTPLVDSGFSWVNQNSGVIASNNGSVQLTGAGVNADALTARVKTVATAPYTLTVAFVPMFGQYNFSGCGICLRDSASGKFVTMTLNYRLTGVTFSANAGPNQSTYLQLDKYTNATTFSATYQQNGSNLGLNLVWMRINDDNSNRNYYTSGDGYNWTLVGQVGRTDFITPDQFGFCINRYAQTYGTVGMNVLHWKVT